MNSGFIGNWESYGHKVIIYTRKSIKYVSNIVIQS